MYEHLVYDEDGNLSTGTLLDYLMPTSAEVPDMVIGHVSHPADNPLGVRGVGEAARSARTPCWRVRWPTPSACRSTPSRSPPRPSGR